MTRVNLNIREATIEDVDLTGRVARCACGKERPSAEVVGYFLEYDGEGSDWAERLCDFRVTGCGMYDTVHQPINPHTGREGITDHEFVKRGPAEKDRFYCGCRGWD